MVDKSKVDPPPQFVKQVKQALEHLYDFPYLQKHPLTQQGANQGLRHELMNAIEVLSPGPSVSFRATQARPYSMLSFHFVEGMTIQAAAADLGISERQAYRDLRRGIENVAALLWSNRTVAQPGARASKLSSMEAEIERLEANLRPIDIIAFLQQAQSAVSHLAKQHGVQIQLKAPDEPVVISADPLIVRQILVNLLSRAIQNAEPGSVQLALTRQQERVSLSLQWTWSGWQETSVPVISEAVRQLSRKLNWHLQKEPVHKGTKARICLHLQAKGPVILVIDDNEGLVELLERYLTGHNCRVLSAKNGAEGLQLAQELLPHAIVLDIMMPEMDGWEVLQRLRATMPDTPVIVCSVFNDPELAYSLHADLFIAKPISRDAILTALQKVGVV